MVNGYKRWWEWDKRRRAYKWNPQNLTFNCSMCSSAFSGFTFTEYFAVATSFIVSFHDLVVWFWKCSTVTRPKTWWPCRRKWGHQWRSLLTNGDKKIKIAQPCSEMGSLSVTSFWDLFCHFVFDRPEEILWDTFFRLYKIHWVKINEQKQKVYTYY